MPKKAIIICCAMIFSVILIGCSHKDENNLPTQQPRQGAENEQNYEYDIPPRYESEKASFDMPSDWQLIEESDDSILLKDTDLEVILSSGFVPDDYYLSSGRLNDEKYADKYIVVRIETYDFQIVRESDWIQFVDEHYPQIEKFEITEISDSRQAIEPTELSGILLGNKIMFIDHGEKVIGAFLYHQGRDKNEAESYFSQIINSLD